MYILKVFLYWIIWFMLIYFYMENVFCLINLWKLVNIMYFLFLIEVMFFDDFVNIRSRVIIIEY